MLAGTLDSCARGPVSLCTHGTSLELTGLLHTPPPTTVHLLQLFLCQLLSLLAVHFILLHNRIIFKLLNLLLIDVPGMSLFPFDIAKIRLHSEQNKLFADFRQDYMRQRGAFATSSRNRSHDCRRQTGQSFLCC